MDNLRIFAESASMIFWPIIFAVLAWIFVPLLKAMIQRGDVSIKIGSFELTTQGAMEQANRQIQDLLDKVARIESELGAQGRATDMAGDSNAPTASGRLLDILWVDDDPANNAFETQTLIADGHRVRSVTNTAAGIREVQRKSFDLIISDIGRPESARAGLDFWTRAQDFLGETPIGFYTSSYSLRKHAEELKDAFIATDSAVELLAAIHRLSRSA